VKSWWLEKELFTYGANASVNSLDDVGHFTQMVCL